MEAQPDRRFEHWAQKGCAPRGLVRLGGLIRGREEGSRVLIKKISGRPHGKPVMIPSSSMFHLPIRPAVV